MPADRLAATPVVAVNYDAGETVGWPAFAATVAEVRARVPAGERVAVLTRNYGEAGAVDHFLPALGPAHSGHNAYWDWGPPPDDATAVIVVGSRRSGSGSGSAGSSSLRGSTTVSAWTTTSRARRSGWPATGSHRGRNLAPAAPPGLELRKLGVLPRRTPRG